MPYDLEDEEGWTALPTLSDSEEEVAANSIGPVHSEGSTYTYDLPEHCQSLAISFQPEKEKRVIELGAGCGLVGLVLAALGATVLLTDLPNVLSLLEANVLQNQATIQAGGGSAHCCELTWGMSSVASLGPAWACPDLVVAADVVYHRNLFDPLLSTLASLGGQVNILAHVRRWKSDAVFFRQLKKQFEVTDITSSIHSDAAQLSSHTRGASRLFMLVHK